MIVGRPLRFLALVAGGWIAARGMMLWPGVPPLAAVAGEAVMPSADARAHELRAGHAAAFATPKSISWRQALVTPPTPTTLMTPDIDQERQSEMRSSRQALPQVPETSFDSGIIAGLPAPLPDPASKAPAVSRSRFAGSAWLFVRPGNGAASGLSGPQLGGSQAGVRLAYALTASRRLSIAARASSPLGKGMRELALGLEWQPTRLPIRMIAEQRIALGKGRGGPTLGLVGGAGPLPLAGGFRLESYAQAGIIGRDGGEGFADGAARVARPVATLGGVRIDLGGGAWGAAQKGASRVDVGPSLSAHVPLGPQPVRISLDWRQRIAGNATPGSGLVLTLGADF